MLVVLRKTLVTLIVTISFFHSNQSFTQDRSNLGDIYRKDYLKQNSSKSTVPEIKETDLVSYDLVLTGGSKLSVVYPGNWASLANQLKVAIDNTHNQFRDYFGEIPSFSSSLRLMDEDLFYLSTGAPSWTNALFYKGQIMIPVPANKPMDLENIIRSVKHEYTHAVINSLSGGNCPGWLDEGLAQWAEGTENPALQPALVNYLETNPPVPLDLLQNGFTKLKTKMVPAAYAQSLFAAHTIINSFGMDSLGGYMTSLKAGRDKPEAFAKNFRISEREFERLLGHNLKDWVHEYEQHDRHNL
jgi:hypothetical protein